MQRDNTIYDAIFRSVLEIFGMPIYTQIIYIKQIINPYNKKSNNKSIKTPICFYIQIVIWIVTLFLMILFINQIFNEQGVIAIYEEVGIKKGTVITLMYSMLFLMILNGIFITYVAFKIYNDAKSRNINGLFLSIIAIPFNTLALIGYLVYILIYRKETVILEDIKNGKVLPNYNKKISKSLKISLVINLLKKAILYIYMFIFVLISI